MHPEMIASRKREEEMHKQFMAAILTGFIAKGEPLDPILIDSAYMWGKKAAEHYTVEKREDDKRAKHSES